MAQIVEMNRLVHRDMLGNLINAYLAEYTDGTVKVKGSPIKMVDFFMDPDAGGTEEVAARKAFINGYMKGHIKWIGEEEEKD